MTPKYKTTFVLWPRRLVQRNIGGFNFVGWVWRTKAFLTRNDNYGWVAFLDDQTEEKMISICPCCKRILV